MFRQVQFAGFSCGRKAEGSYVAVSRCKSNVHVAHEKYIALVSLQVHKELQEGVVPLLASALNTGTVHRGARRVYPHHVEIVEAKANATALVRKSKIAEVHVPGSNLGGHKNTVIPRSSAGEAPGHGDVGISLGMHFLAEIGACIQESENVAPRFGTNNNVRLMAI